MKCKHQLKGAFLIIPINKEYLTSEGYTISNVRTSNIFSYFNFVSSVIVSVHSEFITVLVGHAPDLLEVLLKTLQRVLADPEI